MARRAANLALNRSAARVCPRLLHQGSHSIHCLCHLVKIDGTCSVVATPVPGSHFAHYEEYSSGQVGCDCAAADFSEVRTRVWNCPGLQTDIGSPLIRNPRISLGELFSTWFVRVSFEMLQSHHLCKASRRMEYKHRGRWLRFDSCTMHRASCMAENGLTTKANKYTLYFLLHAWLSA